MTEMAEFLHKDFAEIMIEDVKKMVHKDNQHLASISKCPSINVLCCVSLANISMARLSLHGKYVRKQ